MAQGSAQIVQVTQTGGPYAYVWRTNGGSAAVHTVAVGKSLATAYSDVGTLATALGTIVWASVRAKTTLGEGEGVLFRVTGTAPPSNYAYTWKDDATQRDVDSVVTGKTIAQAYNEIGTLALALGGTMESVSIQART